MNLNLQYGRIFEALGMIQVKGNMTNDRAIELVQDRLSMSNLIETRPLWAQSQMEQSVMMKSVRNTSLCTLLAWRMQFICAYVMYCTTSQSATS